MFSNEFEDTGFMKQLPTTEQIHVDTTAEITVRGAKLETHMRNLLSLGCIRPQ